MVWTKQTFIDPPTLRTPLALAIFIVNIFLPGKRGVGTIIVGALACSCETLIVGLLQLFTSCIIIGWVWSIWWGWELLEVSRRTKGVELPSDSNVGGDGLL
ncbi:unnamed protein product [Ectocarpus sp. CCAP 1310/34]|nr:unnamed protein product [Ectocarpus sp. CCAP 1310/34]